MSEPRAERPSTKNRLHPNNKHRERYDLEALCAKYKPLKAFVGVNKHGDQSVDFANPEAVLALNTALLQLHYGIKKWSIPQGYLCPPIPGRADYIHHAADLLAASNGGKMPTGKNVNCLDIGVGANCIYPLIGATEYKWNFVGSDVDPEALENAAVILASNPKLAKQIELRKQDHDAFIFEGMIQKGELFDLSISNPPFHATMADAEAGSRRKVRNLTRNKEASPVLNFGGKQRELCCVGGERAFVRNMIDQSREYSLQCYWFSTLVSRESNLKAVYSVLTDVGAAEVKTIAMGQGQKSSRIVAWTFLNPDQRKKWAAARWK
jgi:23S rRNA (adenine1618-N6)-methyltransferase